MAPDRPESWIDLDANATTRPDPQVVEAVAEACRTLWANPSSVHRAGQRARAAVELARQEIARLIGASPREIVFTSCATESIHLALHSMPRGPGKEILTSRIEHAAIAGALNSCRRAPRYCAVTCEGLLDLDDAIGQLDGAGGVATHLVNNETGAIQPIEPLLAQARERSIPVLIDATQAVGRMPVDVGALDADYVALSPHKFHGPKGVGVLYVRQGARLSPLIGGAQELARRGGTEPVPAICGAGVAATLARTWLEDASRREDLGSLRDRLENAIIGGVPDTVANGPRDRRIWTTTNLAFGDIDGEALLMMLSERGIGASAGAACSSGSVEPSPVLLAMGLSEDLVRGSIRFSLSRNTTEHEIDHAGEIIVRCVASLRGQS